MLSFSIVLPAYNTPPDILRRAINSVLNQTYSSFELIIVDDGSLPSLEPIVKEYNDNRIKYLRHEQNKGAGAAHNTGIRASQFEWVAFICHDDEWLPNKLKRQSEVIEKRDVIKYLLNQGIYYVGLAFTTLEMSRVDFFENYCVSFDIIDDVEKRNYPYYAPLPGILRKELIF